MRKFLAVVLVVVLSGVGTANLLYTKSTGDLVLKGDYSSFRYSEKTDLVMVEMYYSMFRKQLSFEPDSLGYFAMLNMFVEIRDSSGAVIDSSRWTVANRIKSIAEADVRNYLINDLIPLQLKSGKYQVMLEARDVKSGLAGQLTIDMDVPAYSYEELNLSQIELIYSIGDSDGGNFDKAGKKLIPNTRGASVST